MDSDFDWVEWYTGACASEAFGSGVALWFAINCDSNYKVYWTGTGSRKAVTHDANSAPGTWLDPFGAQQYSLASKEFFACYITYTQGGGGAGIQPHVHHYRQQGAH